jgi:hypothetical protein
VCVCDGGGGDYRAGFGWWVGVNGDCMVGLALISSMLGASMLMKVCECECV